LKPNVYKVFEKIFLDKSFFTKSDLKLNEVNLLYNMNINNFNIDFINKINYLKNNSSLQKILKYYPIIINYNVMNFFKDSTVGLKGEIYFCRFLLRQLGALENYFKMSLQTQTFHPGF
jgi:hypothetical protein